MMESLLIYILKISALLSVFYLSYQLLLKRETSFQLNRKFLIAGILTSAVLPAVYFTRKIYVQASHTNFEFIPAPSEISQVPAETSTDWWQIAGILYLAVTGFFLLRLLLQLVAVSRILLSNKAVEKSGFRFIRIHEDQLPFSFFNYIVFNPEKHAKKDLELILEHEKVHAHQLHSADIILVNLLQCVLWFNPFSWLYKKAVEQNLEFIADRETVKSKVQIKDYQHALIKVSTADLHPALTNHFYQSFIKKRILMLNKKSSTNSPAWKLSLVLPLLLAFLLVFNVKTEAQIVEQEEEIEEPVEPAEVMEEPEIELEEKIETTEAPDQEEEVEIEEAPEVIWTAERSLPSRTSSSALGKDPLYIINGKTYKARKLKGKYISLHSEPRVITGDRAVEQYGKDARNGTVIIADAEVIRNFDKKMEQIGGRDNFRGKYIMVDEYGKPNFVNLNSSTSAAPIERVIVTNAVTTNGGVSYKLSGDHINVVRSAKTPIAGGRAYIVKGLSTEGNSKTANVFKIRSGNNVGTGYNTAGKVRTIQKDSNKVRVIQQDGEPLYVIDGEVQTEDFDKSLLNPSKISSINVIKGRTAIEKYGKKASNGVIEIHTKEAPEYQKGEKMVKIHAGMSDGQLDEVKAKLKELTGIELHIDNISRNDGLITSIRITSRMNGKQISNGQFEDTSKIPNIYVGMVDGKPVVRSSTN